MIVVACLLPFGFPLWDAQHQLCDTTFSEDHRAASPSLLDFTTHKQPVVDGNPIMAANIHRNPSTIDALFLAFPVSPFYLPMANPRWLTRGRLGLNLPTES